MEMREWLEAQKKLWRKVTIRAISVKQPWANMIASGEKTLETRTWPTRHRGPLLIVSSKAPRIEPFGATVALVNLTGCRPMTSADEAAACCECYDRAQAWLLEDVVRLKPTPIRGRLGLYWLDLRHEDLMVAE